jgi:SH3-like domain-containing protein
MDLFKVSSKAWGLAFACVVFALSGCGGLQKKAVDKYVYVTVKQTYLRDRVAAVSNRTGNVSNGEKLAVLDHARRFVKVRTPRGEEGWIDEKAVATQTTFDGFTELGKKHEKDPAVASATVRDEVYMHIAPGRDTEHFFRLAEGDKLSLLGRATLAKGAQGTAPARAAAKPESVKAKGKAAAAAKPVAAPADAAVAPVMEDWWLARDGQGHTGWVYSRMVDVDAPEALSRYAEGQRIVGAYVLTYANDPEGGMLRDGHPDPQIPVYVTVLSPYKAGLPYDFDQVRVFTWNTKKHRYETAFREHNIAGYLPVTIKNMTDPYGHAANSAIPLPSFTYRVLPAGAPPPTPQPGTGLVTAGTTIAKTYRLEGNITRRILPPGTAAPEEAHPNPVAEKKKRGR